MATDGHRLAQFELALPAGASGMPGVIVPRKTVGEVQRLIEDNEAEVTIELSQGKIRFTLGDTVLTSKLIDGTFPDYGRVIPSATTRNSIVDKKDFEQAVDRVSTVSSERGRAVKLSLTSGKLMLSVTNPDSGSATEEIEVEYGSEPLDIGFNSRYLLDIAAQIEGEAAVLEAGRSRLADADPGQRHQGRALRADADAGLERGWNSDVQGRNSGGDAYLLFSDRRLLITDPCHGLRPHPPSDPDELPQLSQRTDRGGRRAGGARWAERRGQDQSHRGDLVSRTRARPAARDPRRRRVFGGRRVMGGVGRRRGRARTGHARDRRGSAAGG